MKFPCCRHTQLYDRSGQHPSYTYLASESLYMLYFSFNYLATTLPHSLNKCSLSIYYVPERYQVLAIPWCTTQALLPAHWALSLWFNRTDIKEPYALYQIPTVYLFMFTALHKLLTERKMGRGNQDKEGQFEELRVKLRSARSICVCWVRRENNPETRCGQGNENDQSSWRTGN